MTGGTLYEDRTDPGLIHRDGIPDWSADPDRSPYDNLLAVVERVPDCSNRAYEEFAFRYIPGLGPESARRALEAMRDAGEWPGTDGDSANERDGGAE